MGIFFNKKKNVDKDKTPAEQDFSGPNPPITGGNAYEIQHVLAAQDSINKNTIPKLNIKKYIGRVEETSYTIYWLLQFHANYFVSLFPVKTKDPKINQMIYDCFRVHFLYGSCGIYKKGDVLIPLYENKVHTNKLGEITKIEFKNIRDLLASKSLDDFKSVGTCLVLDKEEIEKNYARLRTTSIGFGAIVTWLPFIKQQESLLKKIYMYSYVFHRKISYKAQDVSTSAEELDAFFNEDIPFFLELDADVGTGNKFTTESINNGTSGGVVELREYYDFFIETYYHLLGRRYNVDTKKERNITSEVNASQTNFDILHNEDRICKEDFLNEVTRITGVEWEEIKQQEEDNGEEQSENNTSGDDMTGPNDNKE